MNLWPRFTWLTWIWLHYATASSKVFESWQCVLLQEEDMNKLMEERISALTIRFDEYLAEQKLKQQVQILSVSVGLSDLFCRYFTTYNSYMFVIVLILEALLFTRFVLFVKFSPNVTVVTKSHFQFSGFGDGELRPLGWVPHPTPKIKNPKFHFLPHAAKNLVISHPKIWGFGTPPVAIYPHIFLFFRVEVPGWHSLDSDHTECL